MNSDMFKVHLFCEKLVAQQEAFRVRKSSPQPVWGARNSQIKTVKSYQLLFLSSLTYPDNPFPVILLAPPPPPHMIIWTCLR